MKFSNKQNTIQWIALTAAAVILIFVVLISLVGINKSAKQNPKLSWDAPAIQEIFQIDEELNFIEGQVIHYSADLSESVENTIPLFHLNSVEADIELLFETEF